MATYKWAVERTRNAFNSNRDVPEEEWREISRHTTYAAADKRADREIAEMHRAIGSATAWTENYRVIALRDMEQTFTCRCWGPISTRRPESCAQTATVSVWVYKGETMPPTPTPDGWDCHVMCGACRAADAMAQG